MHFRHALLMLVPCTFALLVACDDDASDDDGASSSSSGDVASSSSSSGAPSSSSSSSSSSGDAGGSSSSGDGGSSGAPSGPAHGTIAGAAFTPTSSYAHGGEGGIDLIFGSTPDACQDATDLVVHPHSTLVQLYGLNVLEDGTWQSDDIKYAVLGTTCSEDDADQKSATVTDYTVTVVDPLADPVTGTVDLTFDDGSTFAGTFAAERCDASQGDGAICQE